MVKPVLKSIKAIPFFYVAFAAFCILLLLGLQGFDMVDEGWYLTFYQQIFDHPETVEYNFVFYFTGLVGGLWYQLFPNGGVLAFRILAALTITSIFYISYSILKYYISRTAAIAGSLMVMFVADFGYLSFYYNHFSALITVSIVYFLMRGLTNDRSLFFALAGGLTAINIFARLPNFTLLALILVIPLYHLWFKEGNSKKFPLKQLLMYGLGVLLGLCLSFLIIYSLGHEDVFQKSLKGIFNKGQNDSNHNLFTLFKVYVGNYVLIAKKAIKLLLLLAGLIILKPYFKRNNFMQGIWYVVGIAGFIYVFNYKTIYAIYALNCVMCLVYILTKTRGSKAFNSLLFLAFAVMILQPLGSDGGVNNVGYMSIWLMLPISLYLLNKISYSKLFPFFKWSSDISSTLNQRVLLPVLIGFALTRINSIAHNAYFDPGSRLEKTYGIDSQLASGIYTTKERAEITNEILEALDEFVQKGDYLLAYDKIPMLNFLTETKPYMYNSWVWVYDGQTFEKQLQRASLEIDGLPIIVQQKFETIDAFSEPVLDYMSEEKHENYYYNRNRVVAMNRFLRDNNYQVVWSNAYFNIYRSQILSVNND